MLSNVSRLYNDYAGIETASLRYNSSQAATLRPVQLTEYQDYMVSHKPRLINLLWFNFRKRFYDL